VRKRLGGDAKATWRRVQVGLCTAQRTQMHRPKFSGGPAGTTGEKPAGTLVSAREDAYRPA